ncbi:sensor histidine kinase [Streptomonospora mangrovi]|uniref:sensor histidine kinase n=1 Tax=Streptomonospora mangrovi TaxID=2883123 RepID=UPI0022DE6705|nr:histidine kinase [Streptomonospora mangrovi]
MRGGARDSDLVPESAMGCLRSSVALVVGGYYLISALHLFMRPSTPLETALALAVLTALLPLQFALCRWAPRPARRGRARAGLAAQAVLVFLPPLVTQDAWMGMPGFLAGSALLILPPRAAWPVFALVVSGVVLVHTQFGAVPLAQNGGPVYMAVQAVVSGLVLYGICRLRDLAVHLSRTKDELADAAVARERLGFARSLHDLLGDKLSELSMKCELALRLITSRPAQAREELAQILQISRQASTDMRAVARGYRELLLEAECRSVRAVLTTAGVRVDMANDCGRLPLNASMLLASALREGASNVLRHSRAEYCSVVIRRRGGEVVAEMVNDGVSHADQSAAGGAQASAAQVAAARTPGAEEPAGPGMAEPGWRESAAASTAESAAASADSTAALCEGRLTELAERLRAAGGSLTTRRAGAGRFHLRITLPVEPTSTAPPAAHAGTGG